MSWWRMLCGFVALTDLRTVVFVLGAVGCSRPAPSAPSDWKWPAGRLVFVSDQAGPLAVFAQPGPDQPPTRLSPDDGAAWFAGPASETHLAMLRVEEGPGDAHAEQLFVLGGHGPPVALGQAARTVRNPSWTADGSHILFESSVDGFRDIWTGTPNGRVSRRTAWKGGCYEPQASEDGLRIQMVCSGTDPDLYTVPIAGDTPVDRPTRFIERAGEDLRPTPGGPDGRLAFIGSLDGKLGVWTAMDDGLGAGPLWTPGEGERVVPDQGLAWSPDRTRLAVVVRTGAGRPEVRVLTLTSGEGAPTASGVAVAGIPPNASSELPVWLPDGTLALTVDASDGADIWRVDPTHGRAAMMRGGDASQWLPRWWPLQAASAR